MIQKNLPLILCFALLVVIFFFSRQSDRRLNILQNDITQYANKHKQLQDSVRILNLRNQNLTLQIENYEERLDELSKVKTTVTTKYRDKQKIINASTSYSELDSIIRTNSGLPQR